MSNTIEVFRSLHMREEPLRLPNAWDAGSARLIESLGAAAIATTSAGMAWALGYRDGRHVPVDEMLGVAARMMRVLKVPLSIDIENGYSDDPQAVAAAVARLVDLGVAGINIEDGGDPPELLARKIEIIKRGVAGHARDVFVNARCDVFLAGLVDKPRLVDESVRRGRLYAAAGADGLFLPAVRHPDHIQSVAAAVPVPLNVMAVPDLADAEQLGRWGVKRLSAGSGIAQIVWHDVETLAREFLGGGRSATVIGYGMPYGQLQSMFPST